jgi:hypothetical protein
MLSGEHVVENPRRELGETARAVDARKNQVELGPINPSDLTPFIHDL